jgi:hypothetical protein
MVDTIEEDRLREARRALWGGGMDSNHRMAAVVPPMAVIEVSCHPALRTGGLSLIFRGSSLR